MSLIIKGMELPKMPEKLEHEHEIPYIDVRLFASGKAVTSASKRPYYREHQAFPLPEKHGRLIDADEPIRTVSHDGMIRETTVSRLLCKFSLLDLPKTVIEAEGDRT